MALSVAVIAQRESGLIQPLFPYFQHLQQTRDETIGDTHLSNLPIFASYPSIKCDIVEYL